MNPTSLRQSAVDSQNIAFWDEMCGTDTARSLGIKDHSPQSLAKFDVWFFNFYHYLLPYIPLEGLASKDVLEVGLGYGSVAQKLAGAGCRFHGLDIAAGPVALAAKRMEQCGYDGVVRQGSILEPPHPPESFDWIVSIGCLHHTGNLAAAIGRVHSLLKPGGEALIMVYNATSYRQWYLQPRATFRRFFSGGAGYADNPELNVSMRGFYDANSSGEAAPQTEFVTQSDLRHLCRAFRSCKIRAENIGSENFLKYIPRRVSCTILGPIVGTDLYCRLKK